MEIKNILYLIRSEADLERIYAIAISGKNITRQRFIYFGDNSYIFEFGIKNKFQKNLFDKAGFKVFDVATFIFAGKLYKYFSMKDIKNRYLDFIISATMKILNKIIYINQKRLANKAINKFNPDILITDNAVERENYFPDIIRKMAKNKGIKVHITVHGSAGGLHRKYSTYDEIKLSAFNDYEVGICSIHDYGFGIDNRIVTGDPADSYPLVKSKHKDDFQKITFEKDRKYRIGFFMGTPFETCTNGWSIMEEIMLDYAFKEDVAMIAKFHPRLYKKGDYRYLLKIKNLKLYGSELDRSRLTKWSNIIICSDHCSTIFEPMILGKKVIVIHTKKVDPLAHHRSPVHNSDPSINSIYRSDDLNLNQLQNYRDNNGFINEYCWGGHGQINLGENILKRLLRKDV